MSHLGNCEECDEFGVDLDWKGADGRSVCDDCRDTAAERRNMGDKPKIAADAIQALAKYLRTHDEMYFMDAYRLLDEAL